MILSTHALVGAAIGKNIDNPLLIIIFSLAVHFFIDGFRHGEYFDDRKEKFKDIIWRVAIDLGIAFIIIIFIIYRFDIGIEKIRNIFLGSFFSLFPDSLSVFYWFFPKVNFLRKIKDFHGKAHRYEKFPKYSKERQWNFRNSLNDILISILAILFLILK